MENDYRVVSGRRNRDPILDGYMRLCLYVLKLAYEDLHEDTEVFELKYSIYANCNTKSVNKYDFPASIKINSVQSNTKSKMDEELKRLQKRKKKLGKKYDIHSEEIAQIRMQIESLRKMKRNMLEVDREELKAEGRRNAEQWLSTPWAQQMRAVTSLYFGFPEDYWK